MVRDMLLSAARWARRRWYFVGPFVLVVAGVIVYFTWGQRPGDVLNSTVPFTAPSTTTTPAKKPKKAALPTVNWPIYGYDLQRTHYLPAADAKNVKPPFRSIWSRGGQTLIEYQPVLWKNTMWFIKNNGDLWALNTKTGKTLWTRKVGTLAASSPAYMDGRVFATTLSPGKITAHDAKTGRVLWAKSLGARSESSPLAMRGVVYFGAEDGTVYALRAADGSVKWKYKTNGDVTAGPAYSKGLLYFGDYGGNMQAVRIGDGSLVWKRHVAGLPFGRSGGFYGTPAIAFDRVYVGNLDSKVYSFSARTGQIAWSHSTGNYVYAPPAVAAVPGVTPSVYVGSYDGHFYALDARSGAPRWTFSAGDSISGGASVIGRVVYFSTVHNHNTFGVDVETGKQVWKFAHGAYTPAISDGQRLYLTGYSSEYGLVPRKP
jgi:outer membrane protein assembly factor BamB